MDISEVISAISSSLKSARDLVNTVIEMSRDAAITDCAIEAKLVLIEAVQQVGELQTIADAQLQRYREIVEENRLLKECHLDRERYERKAIGPGATAYVLKQSHQDAGEPEHWLCTYCVDRGVKAVLQIQEAALGKRVYACPHCKATLTTPNPSAGATIETIGRRRSIFDGY